MAINSDFEVLKDEHKDSIELGNGANGTVYRARLTAGKEVAAKKLHKTVPFEAVQHEIDLMSRVNGHPNVVLLIGACPSPAYIVMELIEGPTLKQHLFPDGGGRSTLDMATAVRLAAGVASGLAHLHSATDPTTGKPRPIVHRDLNPNNVMLTTPDPATATLKITDLGLGRAIRSSTSTGGGVSITNSGVRGTLGYIAPEILLDEKSYTHKVDVFSFGMLLWTMLTSKWAYEGKVDMTKDPASISLSIVKLLEEDIDARPAIPSSWPKDLQSIIRRCWATDPTERPEMKEVASNLETFLKN
jgi:serine/threonine protein kinase